PNQSGWNFNCPAFPHISCSNGPNGDLFMNYMDYVDDDCMIMFSNGQSQRMMAALMTARPNLLEYFIIPELSAHTVSFTCEMESIDLDQFYIGETPDCAELVWSTDSDPSDGVSPLLSSIVNDAGVYFAYYYFSA